MSLLNINLKSCDPDLFTIIEHEKKRQEQHIELIASENYVSKAVLEAQGSVLTNKYAEGYPGKRYYGGCDYVDKAEVLAIERVKTLFKCHYANVQPHSGSQANFAVFMALLNPGDTFLGMSLSEGGHLTHGSSVNFSGKLYNAVHYGIDAHTAEVDYEVIADLAKKHSPKMIIAGFSAYSRILDWKKFREIADSVGAYLMVDMAHIAGLVAADLYPSPLAYADVVTSTTHKTLRGPRGGLILARENPEIEKKLNSAVFPGSQGGPLMHIIAAKAVAFLEALQPEFKRYQQQVIHNARYLAQKLSNVGYTIISGGTDDHLFLMDLTHKNITGKEADKALGEANITVNKNTIPNDKHSPFITSGLRLGTPAVTTRGFKEPEMDKIAEWIDQVLSSPTDFAMINQIKNNVIKLCDQFPVYI